MLGTMGLLALRCIGADISKQLPRCRIRPVVLVSTSAVDVVVVLAQLAACSCKQYKPAFSALPSCECKPLQRSRSLPSNQAHLCYCHTRHAARYAIRLTAKHQNPTKTQLTSFWGSARI